MANDYSMFSPAMQAALGFANKGGNPSQALGMLNSSGLMGNFGGGSSGSSFGAGGTQQFGNLNIDPNLSWLSGQQGRALQKYGYDLNSQDNRYVADLNARTQMQASQIDSAYKMQIAQMDAQLQQSLLSQKITAEQYMQQRELAQQEAQFARELAFKQLAEQHQYELGLRSQRFNELVAQSELMSNPADIVTYELFKRGAGRPTLFDSGGGGVNPNTAGQTGGIAGGQGGANSSAPGGASPASSGPELLQAPYADESYQRLVSSLYGGGQPLYNPQLGGKGIFGVNILSPNQFTRGAANQLSDSEMQQLSGFLRAGIDMGGGRRVGIDPTDYFQQAERGWVPTLAEAGTGMATRYS